MCTLKHLNIISSFSDVDAQTETRSVTVRREKVGKELPSFVGWTNQRQTRQIYDTIYYLNPYTGFTFLFGRKIVCW